MEHKLRDEDFSDFSDDDDISDSVSESEDDDDRSGRGGGGGADMKMKQVFNLPYDAIVDLEGSFSDATIDTVDGAPTPKIRQMSTTKQGDRGDSPPRDSPRNDALSDDNEIPGFTNDTVPKNQYGFGNSESDDDEMSASESKQKQNNFHAVKLESGGASMQDAAKRAAERAQHLQGEDSEDSEAEESQNDLASPTRKVVLPQGAYKPEDYEHLNVTSEVKELFQYIGRYTPHDIDLDTKLRCFIPDYIPAVGEIDSFVKIPRPDMQQDELGLAVLDEPSANQSDATVLELQLRATSKKSVKNPMVVRSIENADKDKRAVQNWIDSIKDLHRSKPPPQVHYTRQMPDIETLMQVWPEEVEQLLKEIDLPAADIDLDLKDYARVVCAVLDIPVFNSMAESLHVLFTLYSEFKNNQHFQNVAGVQHELDESPH